MKLVIYLIFLCFFWLFAASATSLEGNRMVYSLMAIVMLTTGIIQWLQIIKKQETNEYRL